MNNLFDYSPLFSPSPSLNLSSTNQVTSIPILEYSIYNISQDSQSNNYITRSNSSSKKHTKYSKDNKICKIKAHFLKYLMKYLNHLIKISFSNQKFKIWKIDCKSTEINSNAAIEFNQKMLFNKSLGELFDKSLSGKLISKESDQNVKNISALSEYSFFKGLFAVTYIEFYYKKFLCIGEDDIIQKCILKLRKVLDNGKESKENKIFTKEKIEKMKKLKMGNLQSFIFEQAQNPKNEDSYLKELEQTAIGIPLHFKLDLREITQDINMNEYHLFSSLQPTYNHFEILQPISNNNTSHNDLEVKSVVSSQQNYVFDTPFPAESNNENIHIVHNKSENDLSKTFFQYDENIFEIESTVPETGTVSQIGKCATYGMNAMI